MLRAARPGRMRSICFAACTQHAHAARQLQHNTAATRWTGSSPDATTLYLMAMDALHQARLLDFYDSISSTKGLWCLGKLALRTPPLAMPQDMVKGALSVTRLHIMLIHANSSVGAMHVCSMHSALLHLPIHAQTGTDGVLSMMSGRQSINLTSHIVSIMQCLPMVCGR